MFQSWVFALSYVPKLNESKKAHLGYIPNFLWKMLTSKLRVDQTILTIFFRDLRENKIKEIFDGTFDDQVFLVNL